MGVERTVGDWAESLAVIVVEVEEEADMGLEDREEDMAGLDAADDGLAKADMSTRARPVPGVGRAAVGVTWLEREGDE